MKTKNGRLDLITGIVLTAIALFYMSQIPKIAAFTGLGATPLNNHFIPWLWSGILLLLSLILVVRGLAGMHQGRQCGEVKPEKSSVKTFLSANREVISSFVLLGLYVGLMGPIGFIITTAAYLFLQIMALTPQEKWKKNFVPAALTGVICAVFLYGVFSKLLNVLLPVGILGF